MPRLLALSALCLALGACSLLRSTADSAGRAAGTTSARAGQNFYDGRYSWVRIGPSEAGGHSALPLTVNPDRLSAALAELRGKGGNFDDKPLFSKDELTEMVPVLVKALAQAGNDQDVTFASTGKHGEYTLFEAEAATAARMFVDDGRLQLVFGMTRLNFGDELHGEHTLKTFLPGSRSHALATATPVAGPSWQVNPTRPDWISVDARWLGEATPPSTPAVPVAPAAPVTPAAMVPAPAAAPAAAVDDGGASAERRLTTLKRLHDKGLISEQEFQDRRKAILDGL